VSQDFLLQVFFHEWLSPKPLNIVVIFKFLQTFAVIFASQSAPPVSTTPVANLPQILPPILLVSLIYQWQITWTVSDCLHLKVNVMEKFYLYVYSTTHRCPNKIIKTFLIEEFCHLPPAPLVVHLELRKSLRIFRKYLIRRGLGETDSWKKPEVENLVAQSL
jgi:hypothetical protein